MLITSECTHSALGSITMSHHVYALPTTLSDIQIKYLRNELNCFKNLHLMDQQGEEEEGGDFIYANK